jgi:hypothetical protein
MHTDKYSLSSESLSLKKKYEGRYESSVFFFRKCNFSNNEI